ncbi:MAG TPA: 50S ribosomal protein L4 [Dehalococcoidia bacterium]|nr:50S ribosomal protein L4 [Dehalococcoidia bacterium]
MQLTVLNSAGEQVSTIEADDAVFGLKPNAAVMHQAVLAHLANRRQGTASTKTRGEVEGSTIKTRRQKGLGRARQGGIRAPHHRHGGIVFGPKPRDYSQALPKRMRRLAIRSALSSKVADGELVVLDALSLDAPKTKAVLAPLRAAGFTRSVLVVTAAPDTNVRLSTRNIEGASYLPADVLNTYDILRHKQLVLTVDAVRRAEALWGGERATKRRAPAPPPVAAGGA